jgi:GNAT superfamily N-acetyltransferase
LEGGVEVAEAEVWIRRAGLGDVAGIAKLSSALFREDAGQRDPFTNLNWPEEEGWGYFAGLVAGDRSLCLLAEFAGETVGYLAGRVGERTTLRPVEVAELESMYVLEEYRGQAVGARLVDEFLGWAGSLEPRGPRSWPTRPTRVRSTSTRGRDFSPRACLWRGGSGERLALPVPPVPTFTGVDGRYSAGYRASVGRSTPGS